MLVDIVARRRKTPVDQNGNATGPTVYEGNEIKVNPDLVAMAQPVEDGYHMVTVVGGLNFLVDDTDLAKLEA